MRRFRSTRGTALHGPTAPALRTAAASVGGAGLRTCVALAVFGLTARSALVFLGGGLLTGPPAAAGRGPAPVDLQVARQLGVSRAAVAEIAADVAVAEADSAVAAAAAAEEFDSEVAGMPWVLILYPDEGLPGYVEAPNLGRLYDTGSWADAARQLAHRVRWDLGEPASVNVVVRSLSELCAALRAGTARSYDMVLGIDLTTPPPAECAAELDKAWKASATRMFISSDASRRVDDSWRKLTSVTGVGADVLENPGPFGLWATLQGASDAVKLWSNVQELWHRRTAEESVYAMLLLIDAALKPLDAMQLQNPVPTFETISRAVDKCKDQFQACFLEPRCMKSLACLSGCGLADQSCSYRCIVSYSNDAFTQFSLCALEKQNLLNSKVERPTTPQVEVIDTFRGAPLTFQTADDILVGHYNPEKDHRHSWLVVAGSNPAYEQFALQYQLWYTGENKKNFWYHPTFLVEALDGRKIWRSRDYRVRRQQTPGIWEFSVLDNGIVSQERWHLLGAADDLSWLVLFYRGAAKGAAIFYRGCLLLTPDGEMPTDSAALRGIEAAVARAGMRSWEMELTSNPPVDPANPPPLIAPDTQPPAPLLVAG
eukprot:TRINITY_DN111757_c0_g1_i1.p1 TRINITY_DN111757_c0_g1~~TRINITY_DN111757_c0_g1_i1.p1  ORF type:complete len:599 (-),score=116.28 TRINITY_DN111757_c0_g1_i1:169-1965(-)